MKKIVVVLLSSLASIFFMGAVLELVLRSGIINNPRYDRLQIQGKQNNAKYRLVILGDSFMGGMAKSKGVVDRGPGDLQTLRVAIRHGSLSGFRPGQRQSL